MSVQRLLVVGGNGFVGSAICKAALVRGWQVSSISSSGQPYRTPKGHSPAWVSKVEWHAADALEPASYAPLLKDRTAVVHTLGTLLPDARYKRALQSGNLPALLGAFVDSATSLGSPNPLRPTLYDTLNRDSALRVFETYAHQHQEGQDARTFVYVSAEDVFRPAIPARYIESKREAERELLQLSHESDIRPVFLRPGLIYHAHLRPLTSPIAAMLSASAHFHHRLPESVPTPAGLMRTLSRLVAEPLDSVANALTTHPIHVEHVASAACAAVEDSTASGPLDVRAMRRLIGWPLDGDTATQSTQDAALSAR
ncbi:NAD(P)-binding protein [Auricularia subglabra TFB-10046 SS5]|nr:NAD(P)-binding protein [Auricularia subglabra TFB-10046 SS5]